VRYIFKQCRKNFYRNIPCILESNPHPLYSFRGLKNQMRIRIACGLDLRPLAGFWKNDRAVRAVRKIKYNSLLFYLLFIIFIIYYSSDSPSSLITESVCLVGKGRLKERCGLEPRTNFFFVRLRNRQKLVRIRFGCGLDSRIYGIHTVSLYCTRTVHSVPCQVYRPSSVHDSRQAAM